MGSGWHVAGCVGLVAFGFCLAMARETHGVSPGQWIGAGIVLLLVALVFLAKASDKLEK